MNWIVALALRLLTDKDDLAEAARLTASLALPGADGAAAYLTLCRLVGEAAGPGDAMAALDDTTEISALALLGQLVVHCFAAIRADYRAQPDAVAARSRLSARADKAYAAIGETYGHDALDFAVRLAGQAVVDLSRLAATRAPIVRVETGISLPSALVAWDLYADPARGAEIVDRNGSGTPMLMPVVMEALAR